MTSTPAPFPDDRENAAPTGADPLSSGPSPEETLHVVDTVEVVETNQPMDAWGED